MMKMDCDKDAAAIYMLDRWEVKLKFAWDRERWID
jgi:hypothetical protein